MTVDFRIPGSPEQVLAAADRLAAVGERFLATEAALRAVSTDGWTGPAADDFRAAYEHEPRRWLDAGHGFSRAARALARYAVVLAEAQARADAAAAAYAEAEATTTAARAAHEAEQEPARFRAREAAAAGQVVVVTPTAFVDPGAAARQAALAELEAARAAVRAEGDAAAAEVRAGCAGAPQTRSWLRTAWDNTVSVLDGAWDSVYDFGKLILWDVSLSHRWRLLKVAVGAQDAAEADAEVALIREDATNIWSAAVDDPLGFAQELGKSAVAWDEWDDNGFHAAGSFLPDVIAGVATGGGLFALKASARSADAVADLNDLKRAVDDIPESRLPDPDKTPPLRAAPTTRIDIPEEYAHLPVRDETAGSKGAWNSGLYDPEPNTVYRVDDRHVYVTDDLGRVSHVESQLAYRDPETAPQYRHEYRQGLAGGEFRLSTDQGGHLIGASLGGPGEPINLVAMNRHLNGTSANDSWGAMEANWRALLKANPDADIRVRIDIDYPDGSQRPEAFSVEYTVNGSDPRIKEFVQ